MHENKILHRNLQCANIMVIMELLNLIIYRYNKTNNEYNWEIIRYQDIVSLK
jgi:hypothetical protein